MSINATQRQLVLGIACIGALLGSITHSAAGPEDDARTRIDTLLARMQIQVLLADPGAYLNLIDQSDPEFKQEQAMWAADLVANTPESFEMTLGDSLTLDAAGAHCDVTVTWTMPKATQREVSYAAMFTLADTGWRYAGEDWIGFEADNLRVLYLKQEIEPIAHIVEEIMPGIRKHVDTVFDAKLDHVQTVKLYTSMRHLQASVFSSYTEPLGGWNEPGESIKLDVNPKTAKSGLSYLLTHEYGHVAMFAMGNHATKIPWWAQEGIAQLAAGANSESAVQRWAKNDSLIDWPSITNYRETKPKNYKYVYTQGHHMVAFIQDQYGDQAWVTWIRDMAQGATLNDSTQDNLHLSFEDLDRQWRNSLTEPEPKQAEPDTEG